MQQLPEIIFIDGVLHSLHTAPLLPWLRDRDPLPAFDRRTAQCQRGYVGAWSIDDGRLWLTSLTAWRDGVLVGVSDLFDGKRTVTADWYSGPLVVEPAASEVRDGKRPEPRTLFVKAGAVVSSGD